MSKPLMTGAPRPGPWVLAFGKARLFLDKAVRRGKDADEFFKVKVPISEWLSEGGLGISAVVVPKDGDEEAYVELRLSFGKDDIIDYGDCRLPLDDSPDILDNLFADFREQVREVFGKDLSVIYEDQ